MISSVTGTVSSVADDRCELAVGPVGYEVLLPAFDVPELETLVGREATLHTLLYLQGDGNSLDPYLVGFSRRDDKRFFERFITVKGVGPKTALRALTVPVPEIAAAIERKDARFLVGLKGVGKRTAELIVAELAGKVGAFAGSSVVLPQQPQRRLAPAEADAVEALVVLGERRVEAENLLARAKQSAGEGAATDALVREMLRLRGGR